MDLKTIFESNFMIFIGIFVTLVVMGTTTLYDKYKNNGGALPGPGELSFFSNMSPKIKTFSSNSLKNFSKYSKKLSVLILNNSGSGRKRSGSGRKKSGSVQRASGKNKLEKVGSIFLKAKDDIQKLFVSLNKKISSFSSSLSSRNKNDDGKSVSLSNNRETDTTFSVSGKVNDLDEVVKSKKDELDFDDDFLTNMSNTGSISPSPVSSGLEADTSEPFFGEFSSELDSSLDDDSMFDGSEFAIKVDGLDDEPADDGFVFNDNAEDLKFGDESDNLLASLKKDIIVTTEHKINFMDSMQGEDLDLKAMKSDLEGVLKDLRKYRQYTSRN